VRIVTAKAEHYRVPREVWWSLPIAASQYSISHFEIVTCEVETDSGVTGSGFTSTIGHSGSAIRAALSDEVHGMTINPAVIGPYRVS
jgi:L-alanine-DL-glutamate epimerase-like enolase superfamily enzyme